MFAIRVIDGAWTTEKKSSEKEKSMSDRISEEDISKLFRETGERHHEAYEVSEGADPEWALFYAGYLQSRLWDGLGRLPTRSELIHLLVAADKAFQATARANEQWPEFYAKFFVENLAAS
jgi:NAD(P)H-hydrate epimerase